MYKNNEISKPSSGYQTSRTWINFKLDETARAAFVGSHYDDENEILISTYCNDVKNIKFSFVNQTSGKEINVSDELIIDYLNILILKYYSFDYKYGLAENVVDVEEKKFNEKFLKETGGNFQGFSFLVSADIYANEERVKKHEDLHSKPTGYGYIPNDSVLKNVDSILEKLEQGKKLYSWEKFSLNSRYKNLKKKEEGNDVLKKEEQELKEKKNKRLDTTYMLYRNTKKYQKTKENNKNQRL